MLLDFFLNERAEYLSKDDGSGFGGSSLDDLPRLLG